MSGWVHTPLVPERQAAARSLIAPSDPAGLSSDPAGSLGDRIVFNAQASDGVRIELSEAQVEQVVQAVAGGGGMSVMLSGLSDVQQAAHAQAPYMNDRRLSRSLLSGLLVVACMPSDGGYVRVTDVARELSMNPSRVHRYIQTLVSVGLVERDPATRGYRLVQRTA